MNVVTIVKRVVQWTDTFARAPRTPKLVSLKYTKGLSYPLGLRNG